jgi:hypothetical protein
MTITYPDDANTIEATHDAGGGPNNAGGAKNADSGKETFGVGDRIDVEAGRRHEVWMGGEGCEYVIGEM